MAFPHMASGRQRKIISRRHDRVNKLVQQLCNIWILSNFISIYFKQAKKSSFTLLSSFTKFERLRNV